VGLTTLEMVLLLIGGVGLFDAICHSLTTMATGGFSTLTSSIAGFKSFYVECVTFVFMILAGTSFLVHYRFIKGDFLAYWKSAEFRVLITIILIAGASLGALAILYGDQPVDTATAMRQGVYQAASFTTTTGYTTVDQTSWPDPSQFILILLMFVGGCVGSTGGALKIRRWIILFQAILREIRKVIHPHRVVAIHVEKQVVEEPVVRNFIMLFMLWIIVFVAGGILLMLMNVDPTTAFSAAASSLGNVGPALGSTGSHMADLPAMGKILMASMMVLGRLEIFIVIVMFSPAIWRRS
jgi:trk system potassium uptake protein TrkH